MRRVRRYALRAAVAASLVAFLLPASALGQSESRAASALHASAIAFDVAILRPLGLLNLAVGVAAFLPAAVLTAPGGRNSVDQALQIFVREPAHGVFRRELGDF